MNYPEKQVNNFAKIERKDNTMIHKKFIKIAYPCTKFIFSIFIHYVNITPFNHIVLQNQQI
jgi:hypothetical protein